MSAFWGTLRRKYKDDELEEALKRAFVVGKASYIILDDRRERFLIESAILGVEKGWLTEEFVEIEEQYSQLRYHLTDGGKRHFGLAGEKCETSEHT